MHLIVFPLFSYALLSLLLLVLWPQRGLSARNFWLALAGAFLGEIIGFGLVFLCRDSLHAGIGLYFALVVFPGLFGFFLVYFFGRKGISIAGQHALLFHAPQRCLRAFLLAILCATGLAVLIALNLEIEFAYIAMSAAVVLPIVSIAALLAANLLNCGGLQRALASACVCSGILILVSVILGPYFLLATPFWGFIFVFILIFIQQLGPSVRR